MDAVQSTPHVRSFSYSNFSLLQVGEVCGRMFSQYSQKANCTVHTSPVPSDLQMRATNAVYPNTTTYLAA